MKQARAWGLWVWVGMVAVVLSGLVWGRRGYERMIGLPPVDERLIVAVAAQDAPAIDAALAEGASVREHGAKEITALMMAAAMGRVDLVDRFTAMGAEVDAVEDQGQTALMMAARNGQANSVRALLRHGADAGLRDRIGMTPVQAARARGWDEVVAVLSDADKRAAWAPVVRVRHRPLGLRGNS